ncbi:MAG: Maf family protein [Chlamydiales bacterium]
MLILGSQSPRRKEILEFFSLPFRQISSSFDEDSIPFAGNPVTYASTLAKGKALSLQERYPNDLILTADTIVFKGGELYSKPLSEEAGFEMLKAFNGKWHTVYTSVCAAQEKNIAIEVEETQVLFHQLNEGQLKAYHKAFKGEDKAGGYGIQMGGSIIIKRIEGCFYNVMGLPITATRNVLLKMGIDLWEYLNLS